MSIMAERPIRHLRLPTVREISWRKIALACGVAASLLYFAMDAVAAVLYDGYSYTGQTISELSAIGAPTRPMWIPLGFVYAVLMTAFGVGVWVAADKNLALRIVALMAAAVGVVALVAWPFAPMHQREVLAAGGGTFTDTLHLILSGVDGVLFFIAASAGATALGKRFAMYSVVTIIIVLIFGFLMSLDAPRLQDNESTPWIGVTERIMLFTAMAWYAVLAVVLLRHGRGSS